MRIGKVVKEHEVPAPLRAPQFVPPVKIPVPVFPMKEPVKVCR